MRIAVMGAGGVGGYFGGRLVQAGHEVTFIARGARPHCFAPDRLPCEAGGAVLTSRKPRR